MQITSLGAVHTICIGQGKQQTTETGGFANLLSGQMRMNQSAGQNQSNTEDESVSNVEMMELLQLLSVEDITELGNESEIFQQLLSNFELDKIGFVKEYLQLTDQELLSSLSALMAGINLEQMEGEDWRNTLAGSNEELYSFNQHMLSGYDFEQIKVNQTLWQQSDQDILHTLSSLFANINTEQIEEGNVKKVLADLNIAFSQGDSQAAFAAFTQLLQSLNMDQVTFSLKQNAADAIHSLKLLQLLSKYESSESEKKALNAFLDKVEWSLNGIVKEDKAANRREFLNQIFTPVLKEAKQGNLPYRQTYSPLLSPAITSKEQIDENSPVKPGSLSTDSNSSGLLQFQQMAKSEQLVLMMGKSGKPVSSDQLIAQFEKILANSQMVKSGNTQRLFIKLNPDHLGMLKVELIQQDTAIMAKITASSGAAKEILESQLQTLKNAFSAQNIQLDEIEITMQSNQQERFLHKDPQQGNKEQQENRKQKEQQPEEFSLSFAEALISTEV